MDLRNRSFLAAGVVAALVAGTLTLAVVRAEEGEGGGGRPAASAEDPAALVEALGDPDFGVREGAFRRLRELGPAAREALEKGAASEDAQVKWSSGRLLGLLEEGRGEARREGRLRFGGGEEDGNGEARPGVGPSRFPDLDRAMEEMRRRMAELERQFDGLQGEALRPGGERIPVEGGAGRHIVEVRNGERREVAIGPDGRVKVTLQRAPERSGRSGTFEAGSVEELKEKFPDIHQAVEDLLDGGWEIHAFPELPPLPELPRFPGVPLPGRTFAPPGAAAQGDLLGVVLDPVPDLLRAHVDLPEGEGLAVGEVLGGSPAEGMGVLRHDILLSVNGVPVATVADVREAWRTLEKGAAVRVKVLRGGRERLLEGAR